VKKVKYFKDMTMKRNGITMKLPTNILYKKCEKNVTDRGYIPSETLKFTSLTVSSSSSANNMMTYGLTVAFPFITGCPLILQNSCIRSRILLPLPATPNGIRDWEPRGLHCAVSFLVRETLHGRVACYLAYFLPPNTLELLLDSE
jgi:hypothetical protein